MKLRIAILILLATLLSACNLTLAEDVTPPPGYIPPTPVPTLVLVPQQTPNIAAGEAIYFQKCAACHGDSGLGDGAQGIQLGVTVPAFALPEIARPASPAEWYTMVTRGKIERFMPPFASLNDQQRWDVVAYIMTLHTSNEEIQKGKAIFDANCADCPTDFYKDQAKMSGLSTVELARIVRLGNDQIKAFGENLSDDDMWAVADYLRSLSFESTVHAQATAVPASETPAPSEAESPSGEGTPVGTDQTPVAEEAMPGFGTVSGAIENMTGTELPKDMSVTLRGYEHDATNMSAGAVEVVTQEGTVAPDGSYSFQNIELKENRIFVVEVAYNGMTLNSESVLVAAGDTSVTIPTLSLYNTSNDTSLLTVDELDLFLSAQSDTYELLAFYTFRNTSQSTIAVSMGTQQEIPFLKFPIGMQGLGYEAVQDSARFISTADGFAMAPSDQTYGLIAYSSVPKSKEISVSQPIDLATTHVRIFVPDGMEAKGDQITRDTQQDIQGMTYQAYFASGLNAGDTLNFTISGSPKDTASDTSTATSTSNSTLLIGAAGLGLALILAGVWLYMRDRSRVSEEDEEEEGEEDEFETSEDVMDAIIALDDLHRAKKISDEAYQKRRAELKEILKEMM